jgi:lysophospholipase L1-like esterase
MLLLVGWSLLHSPSNGDASTLPTGFYLDVGGSSSLGYQPTGRLTKDGQLFDAPTDRGYADDLVKLEDESVSLTLFKIGCPGETVATLLGEKDHCYKLPVTQMSIARKYLRAHLNDVGVVSIDIGFNDVQPCIETAVVEGGCASAARQLVQADLPKVVSELKSAAGPQVHFVGVEYGDPFLGRYLEGPSEDAYATQTLAEITELDEVLTSVYAKAGVAVANGATIFSSASTTPTKMANGVVVPKNVAVICADTYMCRAYPYGPDDHPNDAGYEAIAEEMFRVLPATW